jgi:aspartate aminotransferase
MPVAANIKTMISQGSQIRKMFEEGIALKTQYGVENVFDFSLGNPDIDPPSEFHKLFVKLATEDIPGSHGYMPNAGFVDVRKAIARKAGREHNTSLDASSIVMTVGAAGGLNVVLKTLLNQDDEVIVLRPFFVEYGIYIANHGGRMKLVDTLPDFSLDIDAIEKALGKNTAAIIINSPNNPTGRIYPGEQIRELAELLRTHLKRSGRAVYLVADEPYREIVYKGKTVPPLMSEYEHTIVVTSYSKSLSLPGERIGYIAANPQCDDFELLMSGFVLCNRTLGFVNAPALMQRLVAQLTEASVDISIYERRRDIFAKGLRDAGLEFSDPEGAFYIFCKSPIADDVRFVNFLKEYRILTVPGSAFGGPGYIRICYCVNDSTIERSLPIFKKAMQEFKG